LDTIRQLLEQSPLLALFAAIGLGYALGRISIAGFSLGVGAVLFSALAIGALAPGAAPPGIVSSIGLVMFLYGIGIQYGRQFFAGLKGPGLKWNLLGAVGVLGALGAALALGRAAGLSAGQAVGLFAGALTSTPALQAALDAAGNGDPAIGYSVAYPFGVIGPILCLYVFSRVVKPRLEPPPLPLQGLEITLETPDDETVAELIARLPAGVELIAVRHGGTNALPDPGARLAPGDGVLLYGRPEALERARLALGRVDPGRIAKDRGALDVVRFFVSSPAIVGTPLAGVRFPEGVAGKIAEVRRGDALLFPDPDLVLEYGDRVGVIAPREAFPALRSWFGDSMKSTAEFSYVSVGLGMSLGVLLGLIAVPLPAVGSFSLGLAGGTLIVALVLGRLGRTGPLAWHLPLAANLTLRNFGLTVFLAAVGLGAGRPFVETVSRTGFTLLAIGAAILLVGVLSVALLGHFLFRLSTDDLFGLVSGVTGNPAIVVYANRALPSDRIRHDLPVHDDPEDPLRAGRDRAAVGRMSPSGPRAGGQWNAIAARTPSCHHPLPLKANAHPPPQYTAAELLVTAAQPRASSRNNARLPIGTLNPPPIEPESPVDSLTDPGSAPKRLSPSAAVT
jgi:putative transport protein